MTEEKWDKIANVFLKISLILWSIALGLGVANVCRANEVGGGNISNSNVSSPSFGISTSNINLNSAQGGAGGQGGQGGQATATSSATGGQGGTASSSVTSTIKNDSSASSGSSSSSNLVSSPSQKTVIIQQPQAPMVIPPPLPQAPVVSMFGAGSEPQIVKMPKFSPAGTEPLRKDDKICGAVRYSATGKNLFEKVLEYHEKTYLEKKWNPAKIRMMVVKKVKNKAFSTSGSVSGSWNTSTNDYQAIQQFSKNTSSMLYASGSIAPSYSSSWVSENFDIWFFLID